MSLNWVDLCVLAVVGISALLSLLRGLVREVLSLVGWVVACWIAFRWSGPAGLVLASTLDVSPSVRTALGFVALLVVALFAFGLLNFLIGKLLESTGLSATDKMLGILFGIGRGLAIITVLVTFAGLTSLPRDPWWRQSIFLPRLEPAAEWAIGRLPAEFAKHFDNYGGAPSVKPGATDSRG
jgi:membrane protein required for colicin V production